MIKAFLCDMQALLSADVNDVYHLISVIKKKKLAFVLLTSPIYTLLEVQAQLQVYTHLADVNLYDFISHQANSHFERTNPAFFAEILARVGIEPNEALVITGDIQDIKTSQVVGINGYYITDVNGHSQNHIGTVAQFIHLIQGENWADCFIQVDLLPQMIIPQLMGNLGALRGLLANIKHEFWHQHPYPQEWSVYQIICHLLESEQTVQRPRLEKILLENNPFLSEETTPPPPQCQMAEPLLVEAFISIRHKTIEWLGTLPNSVWQRQARHSIFGPTTFLEMAHFTAQHDRLHLNQLCQTLQKCH